MTEPERQIRVLVVAGNAAHRWHNWETTTPAICGLLERDPRPRIQVTEDPERLADLPGAGFEVVILNYCNWEDPRGLSEAAKAGFSGWVARGGGLLVVHFANGAFHHSLPGAALSDWPEYRRMVRRVWDHSGPEPSNHDPFGTFTALPTSVEHPITHGLSHFTVEDELYVNQRGEEPIEPLLVANSKLTGSVEPLAWVYNYGSGRVFQTMLGHSASTYRAFGAREMLRRAVSWVAGREVHMLRAEQDP
ncbi:MAG TPA: ThuA domain-containing protein [Polyangiaceae bacterium]